MDRQKINFWAGLVLGTTLGMASFSAQAAPLSLATTPLFLVNQVKPSVMVMLDNSGSMKVAMYTGGFNATVTYYGIFESGKKYQYDSTIPVDTSAYGVTIDTSVAGAFKEDSSCTLGSAANCWSGNFLNWLTTRRIDATRMVLVGGKIENRAGYAYNGSTLEYKVVGNNERSDGSFTKTSSISSQYSSISDSKSVQINSPANSGVAQTVYDPYGKISTMGGGEGSLYDSGGSIIGEFGNASATTKVDGSKNLLPSSWAQVTYKNSYTAPVIIAKPPTRNGGDPAIVRIKNVTTTGFEIALQEWDYKDGNHTQESLPYMVVEAGRYTLSGGGKLEAGFQSTNRLLQGLCSGSVNNHTDVGFSSSFPTVPIVLSSVMTFNDSAAVNSRAWNVGTGGFRLSLQEEENADGSHSTEQVGYVAIEVMRIDDTALPFYLEAGKKSGISSGTSTVNFSASFPGTPTFLAAMQTINGTDPASLRTKSVANNSSVITLDEEKSCDSETSHTAENIGYISVMGGGGTDYNVAVVVPSVQEGVLQQVQNDVRLGISFYRYNPARSDIYNGNTIAGGTINFKIPLNPFIKNASDTANGGGYRDLSGYIGSDITDIIDAIEHYPLVWGTTPLAENLWEVIQYFEQDSPYYTAVTAGFEDFDQADPLNPGRDPFYDPQYGKKMSCANSNVLIFTDGEPYKDADIPSGIVDYDGGGNTVTDCTDSTTKNKDCADTNPNAWGHDNLDDVAYWSFCNTTTGSCLNAGVAKNPTRDLRSDLVGDQYIRIDTVGFAGGNIRQILQDTANNAGGKAYAAADGLGLASTLVTAFADIASGSAASVAVTSGSLQSSSKLFLARFNSNDWSGDILAFAINPDGSLESTLDGNGLMQPGANGWKASTQIPAEAARVIFSHNGATGNTQTGIAFQWNQLSGTQQGLLGAEPILKWLRGDQSEEAATTGSTLNLRNRAITVLGDIVHSSPSYVGPPAFQYPDDMEGTTNLYSTFKTAKLNRPPMIYTGANDGMLHAFDASTGVEKFAYVPNAVYSRLAALTSPSYVHQYTADGAPIVVDAYFGGAWRTILAAGLRGGGQAIYALDVTDPALITNETTGAGKVLWEYTDADDVDLGYTYSEPNIVRLQNGDWAAVFGNGFNNTEADGNASTSGNAVLYVVKLSDGSLIKKIDTGVGLSNSASGGRPNGLATVAPTDVDGDSITDYVYAGDLYGNMWKFDLTDISPVNWGVSYGGTPLFTACDGSPCTDTNRQPITVRPQVSVNPTQGGYMIYFGTGQYIEDSDNAVTNQLTQSFYGIWDKNDATLVAFDKGNLKERKILLEVAAGNFDVRITSGVLDDVANGGGVINWPTQKGWYMDLILDGATDNKGERVASNPIFRQGRIVFTTLLPSAEACASGGSGWLMELDAYKGTRLDLTPFDINEDGVFTAADNGQVDWDINGDSSIDAKDTAPPSGISSGPVGIIVMPGIIANDDNSKEFKYAAGSTGNVKVIIERPEPGQSGRQSWRQIR